MRVLQWQNCSNIVTINTTLCPEPTPCAVILTALSTEYLAVRAHLSNLREDIHPQQTIYERGEFVANEQMWEVGIVEIGAGNPTAAWEAERAIGHFNPDVIFLVGIATGLKDVRVGDVVVATQIYGYEFGKVDQTFKPRPEIRLASYRLEQRARAVRRKTAWLNRLSSAYDVPPQVWLAPIAAGEKQIESGTSQLFQFLQSNYEDAIALETEGVGFLEAARGNESVSAMVIRGISTLIDDQLNVNKETHQEQAASHASAFAFEMLAELASVHQPNQSVPDQELTNRAVYIPNLRCREVFGREDLVKTVIDDLQDPKASPILCLGGVAGYGKTEAAVSIAQAAIEQLVVEKVIWISV